MNHFKHSAHTPSDAPIDREYVDTHLAAIPLDGFQPSALGLQILNLVCDRLRTSSAYIVGGALRDEFQGLQPRDIDIHLNVFDTRFSDGNNSNESQRWLNRDIADAIGDIPGMERNGLVRKHFYKRKCFASASYNFQGQPVDVSLITRPISLEERAMYGDATVNAIAADRNGDVMAHPDFEDDIVDKFYRVRVLREFDRARAHERFQERAEAKFQGFTYHPPEDFELAYET